MSPKTRSRRPKKGRDRASRTSRRELLRLVGAGGLGLVAAKSLPDRWVTPIVQSIVMPAHAQASAPLAGLYGCGRGGGNVLGGGFPDALIRLNLTTGAATIVGELPFDSTEIEYDNTTGRAWSQRRGSANSMYEFNIATGALVSGPVNNGAAFTALEFVGSVLYAVENNRENDVHGPQGGALNISTLHTLNPATGASTPIGGTGVGPISGLAYNGTTMFGIAGGMGSEVYTINLATGLATVIGNANAMDGAGSLEFGPDGNLYASGDSEDGGRLYRINTSTGQATLVGPTGFDAITGLTRVN
jgi:hypothetical protein